MSSRFSQAWARCSTCGFDVPVSRIRYHQRFGWQCTAPPGLNCYDEGPHYDERRRGIRPPYEGVRRTSAPLTDTLLEGIDTSVDSVTGISGGGGAPPGVVASDSFRFIDRSTAVLRKLTFSATAPNLIMSVVSSPPTGINGWVLSNGWILYVEGGLLRMAKSGIVNPVLPPAGLNIVATADGKLQYTP